MKPRLPFCIVDANVAGISSSGVGISFVKVHGLQDALDQVTREKRVLLGELGRERERGEEEGRRVSEMEERLGHSNAANLELEKVPRSLHHHAVTTTTLPPPLLLSRVSMSVRSRWKD